MNPYLKREKKRERKRFSLGIWISGKRMQSGGEEFIWVRVKEFEFIYYTSFVTKETYFDESRRREREREE